ncbi:hypothetical protein EPO05_02650 [Patescibacteria group bacterium]|nr:MAG: hypothetical protein EPO05_02650 [Patescibacteria group bacterium]
MKQFLEDRHKLVIGAILAFMAVVSLLNAHNDSLIYDEDAHIPAGYSYLVAHDMRLNPEHPPLLKDLAALPLLFFQPKFDTSAPFWTENANDAQWDAGKNFLFASDNNPDQIIFWSRVPFVLLSLILGWFIFYWTRELAGTFAGMLALTLYAFDPNILGHNHYVTTDLGIASFGAFAFYYFVRFLRRPIWRNVLIAGLFLGLVQLVKFSSVLLFPVLVLTLTAFVLVKNHDGKIRCNWHDRLRALGEYNIKGLIIFLVSIAVVWSVYAVNNYALPKEKLPEIATYYFKSDDTNTKAVVTKKVIFALNESPVTRPLATYIFGVARVFQRVAGGNVTYFFGELSTKGFFSYFPVVFLIKEPLPTLFLVIACLALGFWRGTKQIWEALRTPGRRMCQLASTYLHKHIAEFGMLCFIFIYVLTSITGRLNIGFRHLFPILPFMYILVAKYLVFSVERIKDLERKLNVLVIVFVLFAALVGGTIAAYPYYLSYFNAAAGGPMQGYHLVTDSNTDWGQDLKRLKIFLDQHPEIDRLKLNYFGLADQSYYLGQRYTPWWNSRRPIEAGWYGISTLFLQESIFDTKRADNQSYRWLAGRKPDYQVGTSILIFHVSEEEAQQANGPAL